MQTRRRVWWSLALLVSSIGFTPFATAQAPPTPKRYVATPDEKAKLAQATERLRKAVAAVPKETPRELLADVDVYRKAADWVLRLDEFFEAKDVATARSVIDEGLRRADQLAKGEHPWTSARGQLARGYLSKVDGSVQPYAVIVPEEINLDRDKRFRLDVVLHGRDARLSEVRFLASHGGKPTPTRLEADALGKITLHVFGRTNNAYRWAGETDVFEAIEEVKRNYPIDDRRIVLRGFSMGGAGAWHLGLHHPSLWSSVEAGAGFTETKQYAELKDLPSYQEKLLTIYDSFQYALNATDVPIAGYGGENDPQLQASTNIVHALESLEFRLKTEGLQTRGEGIDFLRLVGAKMGHKVDPESARILKQWHDKHAVKGTILDPKRIRFVTYTTKYGRAAWLSVESMNEHYRRAEVDAEIRGLKVVVTKLENVSVLAVDRHAGQTIELAGEEFPLESAVKGLLPNVYFRAKADGGYRQLDYQESRDFENNKDHLKSRGVQGPIDDAFTGPFLCVSGSSEPWNPAVGRWSSARLNTFAEDWAQFFRGEIRVKRDVEVTPVDLEDNNLILFGDPGSSTLIARLLPKLPIGWTRTELKLGGETYTASDHAPVMIAPNPLNPRRYVVINSGHTFGAKELTGTNALLFPRLGDHAVFQTDGRNATLKASGFFDEQWSLRER